MLGYEESDRPLFGLKRRSAGIWERPWALVAASAVSVGGLLMLAAFASNASMYVMTNHNVAVPVEPVDAKLADAGQHVFADGSVHSTPLSSSQDEVPVMTMEAKADSGKCSNGFPKDFIWGLGTAAYQIEGGTSLSGRQPSIWDTFSHAVGTTYAGDNGDVACDHYHRWREDIKLMRSIGLKHYRLSLSWSRVMNWDAALGHMVPNEEGIAFYRGLLDGLKKAGISAYVTLYHWDLPQVLHDEMGGWHTPENSRMHDEFERYATLAFERFGDSVTTWFTFNEPWTFTTAGYSAGIHAPGCVPFQQGGGPCATGATTPYVVSTNVLNSHARAVHVYRTQFQPKQRGTIGITLNCEFAMPLTESADDKAAALRALDFWLGWWLLPIVRGDYPSTMRANAGERLPTFSEAQRTLLLDSIDVLGINHYSTHLVRQASKDELVPVTTDAPVDGWEKDQHVVTSFGASWPSAASPWQKSYPPGIRGLLNWVRRTPCPSLYV